MSREKAAFSKLVNEHTGMLYRYAYWLSGDAHVAQDLVQETFLRAWRGIDKLQKPEAIKSWLITILRRENARRFERKRLKQVDRDVDTIENPVAFDKIDNSAEAFVLRQALEKITDEYREPLLLQILCGYSCKEIGSMLDLTPEAVMTRLYRARKQLREIMVEDDDDYDGPKPKRKKP